MVLFLYNRLMVVYICIKFHENILDGISHRTDTIFIEKNFKRA